MKGERILYPCYFNTELRRNQGRRVPRAMGVPNPLLADLERAVKKNGLTCRVEEKHHPAFWMRKEGRLVVEWKESKELLLKRVAQRMERR